ncbi:saccharopine dehydrogenase family protein [Pseudohalioglobus lutimaris]|uniref:Saccharopine dehydrogenase n=1 Tax=Pseudohalioglobus lutimaris TaxID=1737061 RepID=A0A2N5X055_9GAMM|nr:saccharopine dehydrogenase NADP-binding domain-containing protein [Pseudohalioglobus lutimaris]PLW67836.1 saccharopine dehydrogenase [Pseudohalioglobus lutimaris]
MAIPNKFDIIVFGASGYTGRLVAEYLHSQYGDGTDGGLAWAMCGRDLEKLKTTRDELGLSPSVPVLEADANDLSSLREIASKCKVVLTTVGPYQQYGSGLLAACAEVGTDYVDLCGEPLWMQRMIKEYEKVAAKSGARIVFSCGFDSVPFDLGVYFLQLHALSQYSEPFSRVRGRVRSMEGSWSGGTLASFRSTVSVVTEDPQLLSSLVDPFAFTPGYTGVSQPPGNQPQYDDALETWTAPFVMAVINTKTVHRSNHLLDRMYGEEFVYDEMFVTGPGVEGEQLANAMAADQSMAEDSTPPGQGPSREERERGMYDILFAGNSDSGRSAQISVHGDMDPGYGSTSKMIAECAVCLAKNPGLASGGIWTPSAAMGLDLIKRLEDNAGLRFVIE